ncbi:OmpP1/FadL family transporter [Roseibium suaedae]|uniref:Long-chain fatty acid transport protein n=1 Tax=Roseibium suaedae TaxID=735517 RepID=A0A1M7GN93_9HYPH|nr:outer membrane protein transport protein [Roseibium suaedae]SHM17588.1 long-chain fatty acid transport protein [Roseibium suaedae]
MVWASKKSVLFTSTAVIASLVAGAAFAGGFALREQSAYYQGMSFAGNGTTGPSISSVFWNPATITGAKDGLTVEAHNSFILPQAEIKGTNTVLGTPFAVDTGDIVSDAWVGSTYVSYKLSDDWYLGMALNAPFGLSTKVSNSNWAGAGYNRSSKVFSINANPMVGYKINDMFSVAVGVQVQYMDVRLKNSIAAPALASAGTALEGDGTGVGLTAGLTFKPFEGTEFGLGYRSTISTSLGGTVALPVPAGGLPAGTYAITTELMTPETVTLSVKQRVMDNLRVLGTFEWTNWSRLKAPKVTLDNFGGATLTSLPFNYNDGYFAALGMEYDFNQQLTLRAGAAYEWSPISTDIRSARLPDNDRIWVSGGASYAFNDSLSFDFGYTHIFGTDTDLRIVPGHQDYSVTKGSLIGTVDSSVDILSASLRYTF